MTPQLWIGIIGSVVLLAFILNGMRLVRGPKGHAANAGMLHIAVGVMVLPVMWMVVVFSSA